MQHSTPQKDHLTAVRVFSSVSHGEHIVAIVLQFQASGLVFKLSTVNAFASCAITFLEVAALALVATKAIDR